MTAPHQSHANHPVRQGFAIGTTVAAACLLFVAGIVALLQGIAALADNDLLIVGVNYTFEFDVTTWGWIHIVLGIIGIAGSLRVFVGGPPGHPPTSLCPGLHGWPHPYAASAPFR